MIDDGQLFVKGIWFEIWLEVLEIYFNSGSFFCYLFFIFNVYFLVWYSGVLVGEQVVF